jgi:hypothetical protein
MLAHRLYFRAIPLLTVSTVNIAQAMLQSTFHGAGAKTFGPWQIYKIARAYRDSLGHG